MFPLFLKICCLIMMTFHLTGTDFLSVSNTGEFAILFREMARCNDSWSGSKEILVNAHLSRKSKNIVIFSGNLTNVIPLDDNLLLEVNFWRFHNERGFQNVPLTIRLNRLCSDLRMYLGNTWDNFFQGETVACPLHKGVHKMNEVNINALVKNKTQFLPLQVLYGRYKTVYFFRRKKSGKVLGCGCIVLDFKAIYV